MTAQSIDLALAHVAALTGSPDAIVDIRMLHDVQKGAPGYPLRGTVRDLWNTIIAYQASGFGAFICVNEMDGQGVKLPNVTHIRAHFADLDDPTTTPQSWAELSAGWIVPPQFVVFSSPGKAHVYWLTGSAAYLDNDRFNTIQRKIITRFNADPQSRDMARVLRLAGTLHLKNPQQPFLVQCQALKGWGAITPPEWLEGALSDVHVNDTANGGRHNLGDPQLKAPSEEWAKYALTEIDPNTLDRADWFTATCAFKQAVWLHVTPERAFQIWSDWCARYNTTDQYGKPLVNDPAENLKNWNSITNTEVGFMNLARRTPHVMAQLRLGNATAPAAYLSSSGDPPQTVPVTGSTDPVAVAPAFDPNYSEILNGMDCKEYFKGCFFIAKLGKILTPSGRYMNQQQFGGEYGGKLFVITDKGLTTDDPWRAALKSTQFQIEKVDHIRFIPSKPYGEIIVDALGRKGVNTFRPSHIVTRKGDVTPFLRHLQLLIPNDQDRRYYLEFIAHAVRFPGYKIPWAPVLVSVEGAGKGLLKEIIQHCIGKPRTYSPKANELIASGSTFNSWQREKLFIFVDEIKVDDNRELVEILKPYITDPEIEIQGKGENQDMEDNPANWQFNSNYKTAIPVNKNGRRYCIFFLAPQTAADLIRLGMNEEYFNEFTNWLNHGYGKEIIADYLLNYPIECGSIGHRAPITSSMAEAIEISRNQYEQLVHDCIQSEVAGFCGGWVSSNSFKKAVREAGINLRSANILPNIMREMGYHKIGISPVAYGHEGYLGKPTLYAISPLADMRDFARAQGWATGAGF